MTEIQLTRHSNDIRTALLDTERVIATKEWAAACALAGIEFRGEPVQAIHSPAGADQIVVLPQSEEGVGK